MESTDAAFSSAAADHRFSLPGDDHPYKPSTSYTLVGVIDSNACGECSKLGQAPRRAEEQEWVLRGEELIRNLIELASTRNFKLLDFID